MVPVTAIGVLLALSSPATRAGRRDLQENALHRIHVVAEDVTGAASFAVRGRRQPALRRRTIVGT
jgi:hypothetical protein